ncbi:unnamed protein product [Sphagnum balticum]
MPVGRKEREATVAYTLMADCFGPLKVPFGHSSIAKKQALSSEMLEFLHPPLTLFASRTTLSSVCTKPEACTPAKFSNDFRARRVRQSNAHLGANEPILAGTSERLSDCVANCTNAFTRAVQARVPGAKDHFTKGTWQEIVKIAALNSNSPETQKRSLQRICSLAVAPRQRPARSDGNECRDLRAISSPAGAQPVLGMGHQNA